MHPGRTYVLGTREQWVLLTLPEGLTLRFTGLSEGRRAHFTEPATGERSAPAPAATVYSCGSGYSLVRIPLGGQYCRKSTAATAKYSCPGGYTLSGKSCYKYTYTNPTGATCPAGYTLVYNFTATPTSETVYSCSSGRLSGSNCLLTGTLTVTYDCDDAPPGYTLSGTDCTKTITKQPTRPTVYTCPGGYDRDEPPGGAGPPTCTKTDTTNATITTTPASCPAVAAGDTAYRLYEDHFAGGVKHTCERTLTVDAEITRTYTCPPNYRLETTTTGGDTDRACRLDKPA